MRRFSLFIICCSTIGCSTAVLHSQTFSLTDSSPKPGSELTRWSIHFEFAQPTIQLDTECKSSLDSIFTFLNSNRLKVEIGVHSFKRGTAEANLKLTSQRAEKLKEYFVNLGIDANRIKSTGYGETKPLNPDPEKESTIKVADGPIIKYGNNRVTITILKN